MTTARKSRKRLWIVLGVTLAVFVLGLTTFGLSLVNVPGIVISILNGALLIVSISAPIVASRLLRRA